MRWICSPLNILNFQYFYISLIGFNPNQEVRAVEVVDNIKWQTLIRVSSTHHQTACKSVLEFQVNEFIQQLVYAKPAILPVIIDTATAATIANSSPRQDRLNNSHILFIKLLI